MNISNLKISEFIAHEVHERQEDGSVPPPTIESALTPLEEGVLDLIIARIVSAVGDQSPAMPMDIVDRDEASAYVRARAIRNCSDDAFVQISAGFAERLHEVQRGKNLPGGLVIVFRGTCGPESTPVVGIIKAERQSGLRKSGARIQHDPKLFMTPQAKAYKVGVFGFLSDDEEDDRCEVLIADSRMTEANRTRAANYFYNGLLGCDFPNDSSKHTRDFYEATQKFIGSDAIAFDRQMDLQHALHLYVSHTGNTTISVAGFAGHFEGADLRDAYEKFMRDNDVIRTNIHRDVSLLGNKLKQSKWAFANGARVTFPPSEFRTTLDVKDVTPDDAESGEQWTRIIIKAKWLGKS